MEEKNVVDRLTIVRNHSLRRKILRAAGEAKAMGRLVSPVGLHRQLKAPLGQVSYHVKVLNEVGVLEASGGAQKRGAFEHHYALNEDFLAEITDSVALDQIAELIDTAGFNDGTFEKLVEIVKSTGRPVEV